MASGGAQISRRREEDAGPLLAAPRGGELGRGEAGPSRPGSSSGQPGGEVRGPAAEFGHVQAGDVAGHAELLPGHVEDTPGDAVGGPGPIGVLIAVLAVGLLAPRTARAIDLAVGERCGGPIFVTADGRRLDRHGAGRIVRRVARYAGISKPVGLHTLRHAFITAALDARVPLHDVQEAASHADPRTTPCAPTSQGIPGPAWHLHRLRLHLRRRPIAPGQAARTGNSFAFSPHCGTLEP